MSTETNSNYMNVYFVVPYQDKEEAKKLGAKWDPAKKLWYAPSLDTELSLLKFWRLHKAEEKPKPEPKPVLKDPHWSRRLSGGALSTHTPILATVVNPAGPARIEPKKPPRPTPYARPPRQTYSKYPPIQPPQWALDRMANGEEVMSTAWDTRGD
jgi:hypothetical protein